MSIRYCLDCRGADDPPYAMCQSLPEFDLAAFGRGERVARADYSYDAAHAARAPVNLWFHAGEGRGKRLPLVRIGDPPGRHEKLLRVEDACFTASSAFGASCESSAEACPQCADDEVCGAREACGEYDLQHAILQVAADIVRPAAAC